VRLAAECRRVLGLTLTDHIDYFRASKLYEFFLNKGLVSAPQDEITVVE